MSEIDRLKLENRILRATLAGAWLDYDRTPGQMGEEAHQRLRCGHVVTDVELPADHAGGSVVYQMDADAVQRLIDGGAREIEFFGKLCFEK